jgi:hypothetical protein
MGASYAVTRWPVTPARVVRSAVESLPGGRVRPRIGYEFFLAGRRYVGGGVEQPAAATDSSMPPIPLEQAESIVARYPVGQEMLAGYDPVNPDRAVLSPRFNWWTTGPALIGALFIGLGVAIWRQNRGSPETGATP